MTPRKLFNNRIFRTFIQSAVSSIATYLAATNLFEIDSKAIIYVCVVALSTALSSIMPLLKEGEDNGS